MLYTIRNLNPSKLHYVFQVGKYLEKCEFLGGKGQFGSIISGLKGLFVRYTPNAPPAHVYNSQCLDFHRVVKIPVSFSFL